MDNRSNRYQQPSRFLEWGLGIFCVVMAVYNLFFSTPYYVFLSVLGLLLVFVPRVAERVIGLQEDFLLRLTSHLYIFLTYGIGMIFNGYSRIPDRPDFRPVRTGCLLCVQAPQTGQSCGRAGGILAGSTFFCRLCGTGCGRLGNRGVCPEPDSAPRPSTRFRHRCP